MPQKNDPALLFDMLQAANAVVSFVHGRSDADFQRELMLRSAVERQIEIIGEAARFVSETFRSAHPEIPWRQIVAQRHILAHDYGVLIPARLWRVATVHVPELIGHLTPLVSTPIDDNDGTRT